MPPSLRGIRFRSLQKMYHLVTPALPRELNFSCRFQNRIATRRRELSNKRRRAAVIALLQYVDAYQNHGFEWGSVARVDKISGVTRVGYREDLSALES